MRGFPLRQRRQMLTALKEYADLKHPITSELIDIHI